MTNWDPLQTFDERNSQVDGRHSQTIGHHITGVFHLVLTANPIYLLQVKVSKMALFTDKWDWGRECNQHQRYSDPSTRRANDPKLDGGNKFYTELGLWHNKTNSGWRRMSQMLLVLARIKTSKSMSPANLRVVDAVKITLILVKSNKTGREITSTKSRWGDSYEMRWVFLPSVSEGAAPPVPGSWCPPSPVQGRLDFLYLRISKG